MDELRAAEERLTFALRAARMGAWEYHVDGQRVVWSDSVEYLFGAATDGVEGTLDGYLALVHPDDRARVRETIEAAHATGAPDDFYIRYRIVTAEDERWLDSHGRVVRDPGGRAVRMAGVTIDVTEPRRLELQARQAQRLDAVGRLAGSVAHDFNNVLTVIASAVALASRAGRDPAPELAVVQGAVERAARLTRQLLAFARRQTIGLTTIDLGAVVAELEPLLRHLLGVRIDLTVEIEPGTWSARADQGQIEQVLVNLDANARDAITDTGRVRVRVGPPVTGGDAIQLTVEDDGAGISADAMEHVFEPFFTTKASGTGLGLASCYGIVEQHGGEIDLASTAGAGTRVEVRLPRSHDPVAARRAPPSAPVATGRATVLLAEDDPAIRMLVERILAEQGYRVLTARDGAEALDLAGRHLDEISVVLTDVVMPRLGGIALVRELRARRPELPVLLMSGYAPDAQVTGSELPMVDKPFSPTELVRVLRALLDRR